MYIRKTQVNKNKDDYKVYLVEGYRDENGKIKQRIIKSFGLLSVITKKNPKGYDALKLYYKKRSANDSLQIDLPKRNNIAQARRTVNYGYFFIKAVYKELGIENLITKYQVKRKFKFDLNSILQLLVFSRILNPASKKTTFKNQDKYFVNFNHKLENIYRSLPLLNELKDDIQTRMHQRINEQYDRDLTLVWYDLTNYYFETEKEDDFRKIGVSKERKTTPIVQMGLLIDKNKIPVGYQLFPGNTHDSKTVIPMIKKLKEKFSIKRTILTADKGINTKLNFAELIKQGDGYIVSQKIRGAKQAFIDDVINDEGYTYWGKSFKYKAIYRTRIIKDTDMKDVELKEKVVIYWSENFDQREKYKREKLNKKIEKFLTSPSTLNASNSFGIKKYIKTMHLDKDTGELKKLNSKNVFNQKKYDHDVALDGYYAIVTSELDKPIKEIIANYHQLWKIEESFKVIKSDLEGRPIFVKRKDHIEGHFLTCFIALTILRLMEKKLDNIFIASNIKTTLANATCKEFIKGYYSMEPQNKLLENLEKLYKSFLSKDILKVEEIKKYQKSIQHNIF